MSAWNELQVFQRLSVRPSSGIVVMSDSAVPHVHTCTWLKEPGVLVQEQTDVTTVSKDRATVSVT
jgi:hypothetical protein